MSLLSPRSDWSFHARLAWAFVWRVLLMLVACSLAGWVFGQTGWWLAGGLSVYLFVQLRRLWLLDHWLRFRSVTPPPDIQGPWGEVIEIIARIYRRKQYHKQRAHALIREFQRLAAGMPEGAALLGRHHELLWFNQKAERWLGLKRKRDIGIRIENLVRYPAFIDYLQQGDFSKSVTVQQLGEQEQWLALYVVQAEGAAQQLLIVRDITREMRLETMRKDFVANASHELRSPLTVISGYLDALADDGELQAIWGQPVLEMRRQAARMHALIEELLHLSRLEQEIAQSAPQFVDMPALLAQVRKDVLALEQRPQQLNFQLDTDACLLGVESELHSLVSNLVSNAVKYTPQEGSITVRWWTDAEGAYLQVSDTGIGIAPDHLPRLTERFYRVDAGRSREQGGFGLGLAIVKHVLQRHDARLEVSSELGKGSQFRCTFPPERVAMRKYPAAQA